MNGMRLMWFVLIGLMAISVVGLFPGCKHEVSLVPMDPTDTTGTTDPPVVVDTSGWPCSPDSVYFEFDILPLLISNCTQSDCHDADKPAEGVNLTSYAKVMSTGKVKAYALTGDFWSSINSTNPNKVMPRPPASPLSQEEIDLIRTWILQGAKNLTCNPGYGGCPTANMSFSQNVQPVLKANCTGCHSGTSPQGGIGLSTYAEVVLMAQTGKLLGAVRKETGYVAMPPSGSGLPDCTIQQLDAWIAQGMLNN